MRSARPGSFSSLHNAAFTAPSIGTFVNNDSTSNDTMTSFSQLYSLMADGRHEMRRVGNCVV